MNAVIARIRVVTLAAALSLCASSGWAAGAHVHGHARADVAIDGPLLTVALQLPQDTLLGFEHRPRTAVQRRAADEALARLRQVDAWLQPAAAARCHVATLTLDVPSLAPAPAGAAEQAHADVDVQVEWRCEAPERLDRLAVALFESFPKLQRLDVQIAGPRGQAQQTLRRPQREILLRR